MCEQLSKLWAAWFRHKHAIEVLENINGTEGIIEYHEEKMQFIMAQIDKINYNMEV